MAYLCIYCGRSGAGTASPAHIFPYVLGGSLSNSKTVCDDCNNLVNRQVERPTLPLFGFFNSYFNIRGHHGVRPIPAKVTIDGRRLLPPLGERAHAHQQGIARAGGRGRGPR